MKTTWLLPPRRAATTSTLKGYSQKSSKVLEPLKKLFHSTATHKTNDGVQFKMSIPVMKQELAKQHRVTACVRTISYALKTLVREGYISRQTQWRKTVGGAIERARTKTRLRVRFLTELASSSVRCFKLLGLTWHVGGERTLQKVADGYLRYLSNVVPRPG